MSAPHYGPNPLFTLAAVVAGFGIGAFVGATVKPEPVPTPLTIVRERVPTSWRLQPQPDMTPAEAALALSIVATGGVDYVPQVGAVIEALPPAARRHWIAPEAPAPVPAPH